MKLRFGWLILAAALPACTSMSMRAPAPGGFPPAYTGPIASTGAAVSVGRGDTLPQIARRHGVTTEALASANRILPPYRLRVGQILVLPVNVAALVPQGESTDDRMVLRPPPVLPAAPVAVTPASPLPPRTVVEETPRPTIQIVPVPTRPEPPAAAVPGSRIAAVPPPVQAIAPAPPAEEATPSRVPPRAGRTFAWPLRGTVASEFGGKPGGLVNDGINIAAPRGTAVRAADNGVVSYTGNELRGFGNLVLIRHADGWITAYAHLDGIDVTPGTEVRRGQIIGRVGQTGNVGAPELHFEIRRAGKPVDPRQFLAAQQAALAP